MDSISPFGSDYGFLNSKYTMISFFFGSEYPFVSQLKKKLELYNFIDQLSYCSLGAPSSL